MMYISGCITNKIFYFVLGLLFIMSCTNRRKNIADIAAGQQIIHHNSTFLKNNDAKKLFEDGLNYAEEENYEKAKRCFVKADKLEPDNPFILSAIGNTIAILSNIKESFIYFQKAIHLDSTNHAAYVDYGYWLNNNGLYGDAINMLYLGLKTSKASKLDSQVFYINLSNSFNKIHDRAHALVLLDSASKLQTTTEMANKIARARTEINVEEFENR